MTTFQISDPAPTVTLTEVDDAGRRAARGSVAFVVTNTTAVARTASVSVVPGLESDRTSFSIVGASPTGPTTTSIDLPPRGVATVTVMISVPLGEVARNGVLSLRAALDGDEDNDVTDSRPVAFSVGSVAAAAPVPRPARFPWWMLVAGAAVVLVVGGLTALTVWSGRHPPPPPAQEEDLTGLVSTQQKIEYLERRKGEIGALTVTVDPSSCIVRGDWIRRKASAPGEGDKATISAGVGSKVDGDCPRAEPRGEIHPKLQAYRTWAARNPDIYASIQPFTIEEIIEFLERRFNEIGSLKLHYDENVCYGLDKVEPEVRDDGTIASDSTGKQIYVALIGTRLDSPCQSDDPRNERRQKIRDLSRWADSRDITTLDRPE